jgi:hypothetical protein
MLLDKELIHSTPVILHSQFTLIFSESFLLLAKVHDHAGDKNGREKIKSPVGESTLLVLGGGFNSGYGCAQQKKYNDDLFGQK